MTKIIKNISIDLSSMAAAGDIREFRIFGDSEAIFSMIVKNAAGSYYNFKTKTFATAESRLKQKIIPNTGVYTNSITFPAVGSPYLDQYDIYLFAEYNYDTTHTSYKEIRFGDGSIDINSSIGSNSSVLKKVIYQYPDVTVTLNATAPTAGRTTTDFSSMTVASDTITTARGKSSGKKDFSITIATAATKALQIIRQPTINDLTVFTTTIFGDPILISGEDIWAGIDGSNIRSTDTVNGAVEGGTAVTMDTGVVLKMKVGDRVTGTGIASTATVTVAALPSGNVFTASEAVTIDDGVTLTFTPPAYYRYSVASGSSIHKLANGMTYVDTDYPDIPLTTIGAYTDTTTYTTEIQNKNGNIEEIENTVTNVSIPAIDPLGFKPTIAKGVVTNQLGNVTFNRQLWEDVDDTNTKHFYAYGPRAIKKVHNTEVILTDLNVELLKPITTTTEATSAHATIAVADKEGVINNISTVDGIDIDTASPRNTDTVDGTVYSVTKIVMDTNVADKMKVGDKVTGTGITGSSVVTVAALNPDGDNAKEFSVSEAVSIGDGVTLTFTPHALPTITSGGGADGAGDWVLSTPQSFESGSILTVEGTSRRAKITGNIEFINVDDTSFTLYFDVEKFLSAS